MTLVFHDVGMIFQLFFKTHEDWLLNVQWTITGSGVMFGDICGKRGGMDR